MKKRNLKRVVSIVTLICMLVVQSCVFAGNVQDTAVEFTPDEEKLIYEEFEVLYGLGVLGDYPREEYLPFANITLGELYGMMTNIMSDDAVKNIRDAAETKNAALSCGLALSDEDFGKTVSCIDAVKMLLKLTGNIYKLQIENKNPSNSLYMAEAKKAGILDGENLKPEKILDNATAMRLVRNTVKADYTEVMWYAGYNQIKNITKTDRTVIEEFRNIYEIRGIVTATPEASIYGEKGTGENYISLDGKLYVSDGRYDDFLGYSVEGYIKVNKGELSEVLYLEQSYKNFELVIEERDLIKISDDVRTVTYYSENKRKTLSVSPTVRVIYNGAHLSRFTAAELHPEIGNIVFIDNDDDSRYDVMKVSDYQVYSVSSLNTGAQTIYGRIPQKGNGTGFYYGDYESIDVYKNGEKTRITEIKRDDVLAMLVPKTTEARLKIYISDKIVTGFIARVDSKDELTVDGEMYRISPQLLADIKAGKEKYPEIGMNCTLHLDVFGEIVFCELLTQDTIKYGFLRAIGKEGTLSEEYRARIFTTDNKWITKTLTKKIRHNGTSVTAENFYKTMCIDEPFAPTLIMFDTNSQGVINRIETPITQEEIDEERLVSGGSKQRSYRGAFKSLGVFDVNLGKNTKIMVVPTDKSSESGYVMVSTSVFNNGSPYNCIPYNMDKFRVADLIVLQENDNLRRERLQLQMCVVVDKGMTLNSEGSAVESLVVNTGAYSDVVITSSGSAEFSQEYQRVRIGDLVSVSFDNKSEADDMEIWYSTADGVSYLYPEVVEAINQIMSGRVVDINDDRSIIRIKSGETEVCMRTMSAGTSVVFYDSNRNVARTGTFKEVAPGDFIIMKMTEMLPHSAVVIENFR